MGEHFDSSLYTSADLFWPAVEKLKLKPKARSMQPTRKQESSTLCSTLAASLPDSTDPRFMKRRNSASEDDSRENQRPSSLIPNGGQDHKGVLKRDGDGESGGHPADG